MQAVSWMRRETDFLKTISFPLFRQVSEVQRELSQGLPLVPKAGVHLIMSTDALSFFGKTLAFCKLLHNRLVK